MHTKNKIILLIWFFGFPLFYQTRTSLDNDCHNRNSVLLYMALTNAKEDSLLTSLLEENSKLLLFINVDSLGYFTHINNISTKYTFC